MIHEIKGNLLDTNCQYIKTMIEVVLGKDYDIYFYNLEEDK